MKNLFLASIKSGKLSCKELSAWIAKQKDCKVEVFIEAVSTKRSPQANRYMWSAVLDAIETHTGHDSEWIHRYFEDKFLGKEWFEMGKERVLLQKTCSMLSSSEFHEFVLKCKLWANEELGITFMEKD